MNYDTAYSRWAGVGPYYAMFPLEFVDHVIRQYTLPGDSLLDPFAGRASTVFSGAALGRPSTGIEINPVGWLYGKTKLAPAPKTSVIKRVREIDAEARRLPPNAGDDLPEFFHWCFAEEALRFLLTARNQLDWQRNRIDRTLMALTLIDLHGVRARSFSNQMRQSRAMEPVYSVRWWRKRRMRPPQIEPVSFLLKKIEWRYARGLPTAADSEVMLGDSSRAMPRIGAKVQAGALQPFSLLFTSPPYIGISDYHRDQWLRLWMLGRPPTYTRNHEQHRSAFASHAEYETLLHTVFSEASEVMRPQGHVYVRTDAREATFELTHQVLHDCFPNWRIRVYGRPYSKLTQTALYGDTSTKPGEKDIVLYGPRS